MADWGNDAGGHWDSVFADKGDQAECVLLTTM